MKCTEYLYVRTIPLYCLQCRPIFLRGVTPELVLLDISLPFFNGYHWCTEIRKVSNVPVVFISSVSDNMNIVMAMNMGGDDFLAKPFDLDVLNAKVSAVLRRAYNMPLRSDGPECRGAVLNMGDATLSCGGERIELTTNTVFSRCLWETRER